MIWFILSTIVAIVLCVVICVQEGCPFDFSGWAAALVMFFAATALAGTLLCCASRIIAGCVAETEWTLSETREIAALNDTASVSGQFFLSSGQVEDEMKYYFVEKTEKGKVVNSIGAKKAYIIESNTETPRIEKWGKRWTSDVVFWFTATAGPGACEYKIYIPENSVTTNFNVDLGSGSIAPQSPTTTAPATTTNRCVNCSRSLDETDNFCPSCGTPTAQTPPNCSACDKELEEGTNFCPSCGTKVN